jgi:glutaredoxin
MLLPPVPAGRYLVKLFRRRVRQVTLYGKPGCHLCDDARSLLNKLSRRYPLEIHEIDITTDPELFRRYDVRIPVLQLETGGQLEAPIREPDVKRLLSRS